MQLHDLTALEQAAAIRRGELSAVELVEHYLARIDAAGERVGAFVTVTPEPARAAAAAADEAVRSGREDLPPLHGVPTAIKDLSPTAGVRTTFGSAAFADFVPPVDADVVTLLRRAGTISLGKTTVAELGCSLYSEGLVAPPARNPWQPRYTAGGSSGGAAAAVAAGLIPFAHGSDGGGSIRIPAGICGVVGYKPSRGLVPGGPTGFGAFGLSTSGPIARTVADAAALLDAMAVPLPGEPYPSPGAPDGGFLAALLAAVPTAVPAGLRPAGAPVPSGAGAAGRLRIGRFTATPMVDVAVDPDCVAAVDAAARALSLYGHEVVELRAPFGPELAGPFETIWYALALSPVPAQREELLLPLTRWLRQQAAGLSAARLVGALGAATERVRQVLRSLSEIDVLLCPTLARPQAEVGWFSAAESPAEDIARQQAFSPYCAIYNLTGQPAVSVPVGQTAEGAPVGVMLAGAVGADALVLTVAAQVEQLADWHDRHPALWNGPFSATVKKQTYPERPDGDGGAEGGAGGLRGASSDGA